MRYVRWHVLVGERRRLAADGDHIIKTDKGSITLPVKLLRRRRRVAAAALLEAVERHRIQIWLDGRWQRCFLHHRKGSSRRHCHWCTALLGVLGLQAINGGFAMVRQGWSG